MAQQAIISSHFCAPHPMNLAVDKEVSLMSDQKYVVKDVNGKLVFRVIGIPISLHNRRIIVDAENRAIVTLRKEMGTGYSRWEAFRGDSSDPKDLIFITKKSSMIQLNTKFHVFLTNNTSQEVPDYTLNTGSSSEHSCVVYAGDSSNIVAQVQKESSVLNIFGMSKSMVTVHPNVDYAFIVALIIILEEIEAQHGQYSSS